MTRRAGDPMMNHRSLAILLHAILGAAAVAAFSWALEARHAAGALPIERVAALALGAAAWAIGWTLLLVHDRSSAGAGVVAEPRGWSTLAGTLALPALGSDALRAFAVVVFAYGALVLVLGGGS
jgi:hypothetical protein